MYICKKKSITHIMLEISAHQVPIILNFSTFPFLFSPQFSPYFDGHFCTKTEIIKRHSLSLSQPLNLLSYLFSFFVEGFLVETFWPCLFSAFVTVEENAQYP